MTNGRSSKARQIRVVTVVLFLCVALGGLFYPRFAAAINDSDVTPNLTPQETPAPRKSKRAKTVPTPAPQVSKYSRFTHKTHGALKLACDSCHKFPSANWEKVRDKDAAFPDITDYPKHESCVSCHRQQFFSGRAPAICTICHVSPSPRNNSRHPFANPREIFDQSPKGKQTSSEFEIAFPHDKHIDIVSNNVRPNSRDGAVYADVAHRRAGEESCNVCHKTYKPQDKSDDEYFTPPPKDLGDAFWLKKGTFKTGPGNHSACFTCHSADTGILPAPTDCATCHKVKEPQISSDFDPKLAEKMTITDKEMLLDWRRRDSSGTFRHEWFSHAELSCATCHNAAAMNTTDAATKKVKVLSCGGGGSGCHITPTSDDGGILNFEIDSRKKDANFQCVKCHITFGRSPVPNSHLGAISEIAKGAK